jgi:bifunctional non-homologous end joining protein LigD
MLRLVVAVSHGTRVVYPADGWTKADVVAHYGRVAPRMLPHIARRPLTMVRHRTNIDEKGFFQKNAPDHFPPSIARIEIAKEGGVTRYPSVDDAESLQYLANQGAVELHIALVKADQLERPDRLVFDLDLAADDPAAARAAARQVRALLDELGAPSTPVASGGKGYHICVALAPTADGEAVGHAALVLANVLAARHPDALTIETLKKHRRGRVYLDWLRNVPGATVVAPYSLRARPRAPVATPIAWDELDEIAPGAITLATIEARLDRPDPLLALEAAPVDAAAMCARAEELRASLGLALVRYDRFGRPVAP